MNLYSLLKRGPHGTAILRARENDARMSEITKAAEASRAQWLDALLVDQTRTWMNIGEIDRDALANNTIMLTIAGFCHVYDGRQAAIESVDMRIIRGAISAATQACAAGGVLTVADAQAFNAAATRAATIVQNASVAAIVHAAEAIRRTVGIADASAQSPGAQAATQTVVAAL